MVWPLIVKNLFFLSFFFLAWGFLSINARRTKKSRLEEGSFFCLLCFMPLSHAFIALPLASLGKKERKKRNSLYPFRCNNVFSRVVWKQFDVILHKNLNIERCIFSFFLISFLSICGSISRKADSLTHTCGQFVVREKRGIFFSVSVNLYKTHFPNGVMLFSKVPPDRTSRWTNRSVSSQSSMPLFPIVSESLFRTPKWMTPTDRPTETPEGVGNFFHFPSNWSIASTQRPIALVDTVQRGKWKSFDNNCAGQSKGQNVSRDKFSHDFLPDGCCRCDSKRRQSVVLYSACNRHKKPCLESTSRKVRPWPEDSCWLQRLFACLWEERKREREREKRAFGAILSAARSETRKNEPETETGEIIWAFFFGSLVRGPSVHLSRWATTMFPAALYALSLTTKKNRFVGSFKNIGERLKKKRPFCGGKKHFCPSQRSLRPEWESLHQKQTRTSQKVMYVVGVKDLCYSLSSSFSRWRLIDRVVWETLHLMRRWRATNTRPKLHLVRRIDDGSCPVTYVQNERIFSTREYYYFFSPDRFPIFRFFTNIFKANIEWVDTQSIQRQRVTDVTLNLSVE